MNIILFGPPGAGKGTQARLIRDHYGLDLISTGDILREEIRKKTVLGVEVEDIIAKGKFPSDDIILRLFRERLPRSKECGVILDGLPRTLNQAQQIGVAFEQVGSQIDVVIQLAVDEEELIKRLSSRVVCKSCGAPHVFPQGRGECSQCASKEFLRRPDDEPEAIRTRLAIYNEQTRPLLDRYAQQGLLKVVDGMKTVEEVNKSVETHLGPTQVLTRKSGCLYSAKDI